jgi:hypothetical protein
MTAQHSVTGFYRRSAPGLVAAVVLAAAALAACGPAEARWQSEYGWGVAGVAAGALALGAIAEASREPTLIQEPAEECYQVRRKVWTGNAWRIERRTICE